MQYEDFCAMQEQAVRMVNQFRRRHGKSALKVSVKQGLFAQKHSKRQSRRRNMYHSNDFGSVGNRENVAYGVSSIKEAINMWINSPGHRANMLAANSEMGIGFHNGFWTQVLS